MLVLAVSLSLCACSSSPVDRAEPGSQSSSSAALESGKLSLPEFSLPVQVNVQPTPPKVLKENELHIVLPPEEADKWKHAKVSVTLSMPSMDHGDLQSEATYQEPGEFVAILVPTMVGEWKADIRFEADGKSSTVSYLFTAEP